MGRSGASVLAALVVVAILGIGVSGAVGQTVAALPVTQRPAMKQSKFEVMASRTGVLVRKEKFQLLSGKAEGMQANVIRMEDMAAHDVVLSFQVELPEKRGLAVVSEEEMADLKGCMDYIAENLGRINESSNPVTMEYRALSNAVFGYTVHRVTQSERELPPTAFVEVPENPYLAQNGGFQKVSLGLLQRIVAEAQQVIEEQRAKK
jgi:hypothetical protein